MDEMTDFGIEIGLLRMAESRFGVSKKPSFEPKGGFERLSAAFAKFVDTA